MTPRTYIAAAFVAALFAQPASEVLAQPASAQGYAAPPPAAPVDLSAYTPTSGLPDIIAANAPVKPADITAALAPYSTTAALKAPDNVAYFGSQMISSGQVQPAGSYATTSQLNAVQATIPSLAGYALTSQIPSVANFITLPQAIAAAPVQKVNGQTGNITLPTYTRQVNATPITPDAQGNATFTFPTPFTSVPSCPGVEVMATTTQYVFAQPVTISKTTTSVTINLTAIPKTVSVGALGASLPLSAPPPSGTQVNFFCIAPN